MGHKYHIDLWQLYRSSERHCFGCRLSRTRVTWASAIMATTTLRTSVKRIVLLVTQRIRSHRRERLFESNSHEHLNTSDFQRPVEVTSCRCELFIFPILNNRFLIRLVESTHSCVFRFFMNDASLSFEFDLMAREHTRLFACVFAEDTLTHTPTHTLTQNSQCIALRSGENRSKNVKLPYANRNFCFPFFFSYVRFQHQTGCSGVRE